MYRTLLSNNTSDRSHFRILEALAYAALNTQMCQGSARNRTKGWSSLLDGVTCTSSSYDKTVQYMLQSLRSFQVNSSLSTLGK